MTLPTPQTASYRVSMVCLGNICRSPMAAAVMQAKVERAGLGDAVVIDSAGTGSWHVGDQADPRARAALARRGYDGESHRARQFSSDWFDSYDLIVAMDHDNLRTLRRLAPDDESAQRVLLLRGFDADGSDADDQAVPDPYYGDERDFETGLDIIERSVDGLVSVLHEQIAQTR